MKAVDKHLSRINNGRVQRKMLEYHLGYRQENLSKDLGYIAKTQEL